MMIRYTELAYLYLILSLSLLLLVLGNIYSIAVSANFPSESFYSGYILRMGTLELG